MRYGTETRLSPDEVIERARAFFGADGKLGLPELPGGEDSATFGAESGGVTVSAVRQKERTKVTVLSREYDSWAEKFIRELH